MKVYIMLVGMTALNVYTTFENASQAIYKTWEKIPNMEVKFVGNGYYAVFVGNTSVRRAFYKITEENVHNGPELIF